MAATALLLKHDNGACFKAERSGEHNAKLRLFQLLRIFWYHIVTMPHYEHHEGKRRPIRGYYTAGRRTERTHITTFH